MRIAAPLTADTTAITGLLDADELHIWDGSDPQRHESLPNPATGLPAGRRLAALNALIERRVDVVCATPHALCTTSYAVARAAGVRFVAIEDGTPARLVGEHPAALIAAASCEMPIDWLARPAPMPVAPTTGLGANGPSPLSETTRRALGNRLKRLEGQVRGAHRLLDEQQSCEAILIQLAAIRSAVNAVALTVLAENLAACLALGDQDPASYLRIESAKRAFQRLN